VASVRVVVVEDHEQFRRLICSTVEKAPELQVVGIVSDGRTSSGSESRGIATGLDSA
jgi:chemotaxis response regulator CheB